MGDPTTDAPPPKTHLGGVLERIRDEIEKPLLERIAFVETDYNELVSQFRKAININQTASLEMGRVLKESETMLLQIAKLLDALEQIAQDYDSQSGEIALAALKEFEIDPIVA